MKAASRRVVERNRNRKQGQSQVWNISETEQMTDECDRGIEEQIPGNTLYNQSMSPEYLSGGQSSTLVRQQIKKHRVFFQYNGQVTTTSYIQINIYILSVVGYS